MMKASNMGIRMIEQFEACKLRAYRDLRNIPTIGYGHTRNVKMSDTCTQAQADRWLHDDVAIAEAAINHLVKVPLTQQQFDALTSLIFNIGSGAFAGSSILKRINAGDFKGAAALFGAWNHVKGVVSADLTRRRASEAALFLSTETTAA